MTPTHLRAIGNDASQEQKPAFAFSTGTFDRAELELQASLRLNAVGATRAAQERAGGVARSAEKSRWRIASLCLMAANAEERDDIYELHRLIHTIEAELEANTAEISPTEAARYKAFIEMRRGIAGWYASPRKEDLEMLDRGIDRFFVSEWQRSTAADPMSQMLVRSALSSSSVLSDMGDLPRRVAVLRDLQRMLLRMPHAPDHLELELQLHSLKTDVLLKTDHHGIGLEMGQTMMRAQQLGLPGLASEAAHYSGWIAARAGDVQRARTFQSSALAFAEVQDSSYTRSLAYTCAAQIETIIGTPQRSLELARSATNTVGTPKLGGLSGYVLARAQLKCGLPEDALDMGSAVVRAASAPEIGRGATLLVMAEAAAKLGRRKAAAAHLRDGIARLKIYGNSYLLSEAKSIQSRLGLRSA